MWVMALYWRLHSVGELLQAMSADDELAGGSGVVWVWGRADVVVARAATATARARRNEKSMMWG